MTEEMGEAGYVELKCKECGLVVAYVRGDVTFDGDFLCLACAYNDRDLGEWVEHKDD